MTRLYVECPLHIGGEIALPEEAAHHFVKVLRARAGDAVCLFNGEGGEYHGQLSRVEKRGAWVALQQHIAGDKASPLRVQLGQVLSRGERMDYAIQKATELGVTDIVPLYSERCEVRLGGDERLDRKLAHWQRVASSACEQCGLNRVPRVLPPQPLDTWLAQADADLKLVMAPAPGALPALTPPPQRICVLIGPEGGLSAAEISRAQAAGFQPWGLGPRVLRTETAPVAALSVLHWLYGDLQG